MWECAVGGLAKFFFYFIFIKNRFYGVFPEKGLQN